MLLCHIACITAALHLSALIWIQLEGVSGATFLQEVCKTNEFWSPSLDKGCSVH